MPSPNYETPPTETYSARKGTVATNGQTIEGRCFYVGTAGTFVVRLANAPTTDVSFVGAAAGSYHPLAIVYVTTTPANCLVLQ